MRTFDKSFRITGGKGMQVKFPNGWVVSIQMGPGNYCDYHHASVSTMLDPTAMTALMESGSDTVETAVYHGKTGEWIRPPWNDDGDDVQGWQTSEDVLKLLVWAASLPPMVDVVEDVTAEVVSEPKALTP